MGNKKSVWVFVVVSLMLFAGCANMEKRTKCIASCATIGAAIGAGSGAVIGNQGPHDTDNNKQEGALVGAAAGGVIGGIVGMIVCEAEVDTDGDGVLDDKDKCPNTPAGVAVNEIGCPPDTDGDGVPDYKDKCPDTPKGQKVDENGCLLDTDGDGVPDYKDKCPDTPKGQKVDENGCPLDTDGDGVLDYKDKCPDTPAGSKVDENGCPRVGEKMFILRGVHFALDSARLTEYSQKILDQTATVLNNNSKIEVRIEGHTDSTGSETYNAKLSQKRARAVKVYLVSKGVAAKRLKVKGMGEKYPVESNNTEEGRKKNRRIEFIVISK